MNDFLSSFTNDNYDPERLQTPPEGEPARRVPARPTNHASGPPAANFIDPREAASEAYDGDTEQTASGRPLVPNTQETSGLTRPVAQSADTSRLARPVAQSADTRTQAYRPTAAAPKGASHAAPLRRGPVSRFEEENTSIDTSFKRKKIIKRVVLIVVALVLVGAAIAAYYFSTHVEVPSFVEKPLVEAETWAVKNDMQVEVETVYDFAVAKDTVMSQNVEESTRLAKGETISLVVSAGPDPDEHLELPDFLLLDRAKAEAWVADNKATSATIVTEHHPDIPTDGFLRYEFRSAEINESNYRRKDYITLYYSKGPEVFEKNIAVPDFAGKVKEDVETWAKEKGIAITFTEEGNETVAAGGVISQSVPAGENLAKNDTMDVVLSKGKMLVVPNFGRFTSTTAAGAADGIAINLKEVYHSSVPYGAFISQSYAAGTTWTQDEAKAVDVTYSLGQPFLRDYRGQLQGDLPQMFFQEYQSKGASVRYELVYVDSWETKGSIVNQSEYNAYVPLDYTVVIYVSLGNLTPPEPAPTPESIQSPDQIVRPDQEEKVSRA